MKFLKYVLITLALLTIIFLVIGLMTPSVKYQTVVLVSKPVEQSFDVLVDADRMAEWMPNFKSIEMVSGEPHTIGSVSRLVVVEDGTEYVMTEMVTGFVSGEYYSFVLDNDVMTVVSEIRFENADGMTRIMATDEVRGKNLFWRSLFPFFKGMFNKNSQQVYDNLKRVIEGS